MRQLENICHWLTVMAPAQMIEPKDLPPEVAALVPAEPVVRAEAARTSDDAIVIESRVASTVAPGAEGAVAFSGAGWETGLEAEALELLATGRHDVWDELTKRFESKLILTALANTRGRRIEAAQRLGIGRNTITRKIQELGLE